MRVEDAEFTGGDWDEVLRNPRINSALPLHYHDSKLIGPTGRVRPEYLTFILSQLVMKNLGVYDPLKQDRSVLLFWRTPDEWAEVLHSWVCNPQISIIFIDLSASLRPRRRANLILSLHFTKLWSLQWNRSFPVFRSLFCERRLLFSPRQHERSQSASQMERVFVSSQAMCDDEQRPFFVAKRCLARRCTSMTREPSAFRSCIYTRNRPMHIRALATSS